MLGGIAEAVDHLYRNGLVVRETSDGFFAQALPDALVEPDCLLGSRLPYLASLVKDDRFEQKLEGAIEKARAIALATEGAFLPSQFDNPENPRVHERTTAREILHAMAGERIDAFVVGVGTGGTISGVGRALKARLAHPPRIIAVEPEASATISRGERGPTKIQGLAAGFVPNNYDASVVDEVRTVSDRDAYETKVALARREGLLVGISSGASVKVALDVAREMGPEATIVTVLFDTGERYFSLDTYFTEEADR